MKNRFGLAPKIFSLIALLFLLDSCLAGRSLEVDFSDARLPQGGLALIHMRDPLPGTPVEGAFKAGKTVIIKTKKGGTWAIVAADLESVPGRYYITFRRGKKEISTSLRLVSGDFGTSRIHLPPDMVEFDEETLARIKREKAELEAALSSSISGRLWKGPFIMPLKGRVSGSFGERRILNGQPRSPHSGLDIAAPAGTPVKAAAAGQVAFTGTFFFYGNFVVIDHGLGVFTLYAHLKSTTVKKGDKIKKGEAIGLVGSTGRATGPHLHFALTINGARVSPQGFIAITERLSGLMAGTKSRRDTMRPSSKG